jgi:hypothetical protein
MEGLLFLVQQDDKPLCLPLDRIETVLKDYHESAFVAGRMANGNVLVIYTSRSGSWTLVIVAPSGIGCVGPMGGEFRLMGKGA